MTRASRGRAAHRRTQLRPGGEDALGHVWHTEASSTRGETVQRCSRCHSLGSDPRSACRSACTWERRDEAAPTTGEVGNTCGQCEQCEMARALAGLESSDV